MTYKGLDIELASSSEAAEITALAERVQAELPNKDYYVISDEARTEWKLEENSFAYVAKDGADIVAFFIFMMPGFDREENLGYDIGLSDSDLARVLCMDSVAVDSRYRGLGLQMELLKLGEAEGLRRGYDVFMATVDPRNTPSLRNFLNSGYDIVRVKESYYAPDVPRALLLKCKDKSVYVPVKNKNGIRLA